MAENTLAQFQLLKQKLQTTLQVSYPHFTQHIHEWKAQEITALQEALHQKVKGYISEKWFYTHLKPTQNEKLPRIDMLDMLSQYVGYACWQDFVFKERGLAIVQVPEKRLDIEIEKTKAKPFLKYILGIALACLVLVGIWALSFLPTSVQGMTFCFEDADTQKPIYQGVSVWKLQEKESPTLCEVRKNGCVHIKEAFEKITLVVKAPYYKTDTIVRTRKQGQTTETIKLKRDDYALLISLIAKHGTTQDEKQQRQKQLNQIFDAEAQIFQIDEAGLGIELYGKEEFIDKLSLPISSLKDIQIIETQYLKGKIILLRFLQR